MLTTALVVLLAFALSALTYLRLERVGRPVWAPLIFRAIAWASLGLLLVNLSCPVRGTPRRPLILLDASLSLGAAGGRWDEARDSAIRWGEVRAFGDERPVRDTVPSRGRSLLAPALLAASASERPVVIVSDGEIEDRQDIPPDILDRSGVRLFSREPRPDFAVTSVEGPARITAGDSLPLEVVVQSRGLARLDTATIEVTSGGRRLGRRAVRLTGENAGRARIVIPSTSLSPGTQLLRISPARKLDDEPRTDTRLHLVTVTPTPGVVLLAGPGDWDSRFLFRTIREVSRLPVRGYVRLEGSRWRSMSDLRPVPLAQVRRAVRQADLLVLKGGVGALAEGSRARGWWIWPSGETGGAPVPGDWYLVTAPSSPLGGAFLGQPVDSFPPAVQLTPIPPLAESWTALSAQLGRRGPVRPAVFGSQSGRVRRVTVAVDGLWRWAFRGGSSEQAYRSWVAATASWLLGGVDSTEGITRPLQPVVQNGRPVTFEWLGSGPAQPIPLTWSGGGRQWVDTLHFDGNGRATVWLEPGEYRYRTQPGGTGLVAVEEFSDELLPRPVTLTAHQPRTSLPGQRSSARDWLWLFALCVLALSGEWFTRRRLGLR
jgi:hypothetical protein